MGPLLGAPFGAFLYKYSVGLHKTGTLTISDNGTATAIARHPIPDKGNIVEPIVGRSRILIDDCCVSVVVLLHLSDTPEYLHSDDAIWHSTDHRLVI